MDKFEIIWEAEHEWNVESEIKKTMDYMDVNTLSDTHKRNIRLHAKAQDDIVRYERAMNLIKPK